MAGTGTTPAVGVDQPDEGGTSLSRDLLLVLQHLRDEGFTETAHSLERESGLYLDIKHLEDLVRCGAWDDAERYLRGFTGAWGKEDPCSARIFSAICRHKGLEALGRRITAKDREDLMNDPKALASYDEEAAKMVRDFESFRDSAVCFDTASVRNAAFLEIKNLIEANQLFKDKLDFPLLEAPRLRDVGNQSLNWQHSRCEKPKQRPEVMALYSDHSCDASLDGAKSETEERKMDARRTKVESEKIKTWKLADIYDSGHLQSLCMPDPDKLARTRSKVVGLLYTSDGIALWALGSNAIFKCWKWQHSDRNPKTKLWLAANGISMKNDTSNGNPEEAIACIAMSKIGRVMSASGSKVSLFCVKTCRLLSTSNGPPLSFIAFHPEACEIVAFGMIDGTILVCSYFGHQARVELRGHQNMITGLAFPRARIVLVSSSADGQICVWWGLSGVVKKRSRYIQSSEKWPGPLVGDTRVQFQSDSTDFLVVHKSQLAIYNLDLECLCLWSPRDTLPAPISSAVYSCDYLLVYTGFCDGAIGIFEAKSLSLRCRIAPYAYVPPSISLSVGHIYPVVVSAHPSKPNQIALGMSDGTVHVLEPLDEDPNQGGEHLLLMSNDNGADP